MFFRQKHGCLENKKFKIFFYFISFSQHPNKQKHIQNHDQTQILQHNQLTKPKPLNQSHILLSTQSQQNEDIEPEIGEDQTLGVYFASFITRRLILMMNHRVMPPKSKEIFYESVLPSLAPLITARGQFSGLQRLGLILGRVGSGLL